MKNLDRTCEPGDRVRWGTVSGVTFEGVLIEWDSNVAVVRLPDGRIKSVEC